MIAYLVPKQLRKKGNRNGGVLEGKASVVFKDDFKMTAEEFLGV